MRTPIWMKTETGVKCVAVVDLPDTLDEDAVVAVALEILVERAEAEGGADSDVHARLMSLIADDTALAAALEQACEKQAA